MDELDVLRNSRNFFIEKLRSEAERIRPTIQRVLQFDQDIGDSTDILAILTEGASVSVDAGIASGSQGISGVRPKLRPDEYMGKTYIDAAENYLDRIGHAVSLDELLDALKSGGCPVGGKTPKKTLYISLVRSREFKPVTGRTGFVGLKKWYEGKRKK